GQPSDWRNPCHYGSNERRRLPVIVDKYDELPRIDDAPLGTSRYVASFRNVERSGSPQGRFSRLAGGDPQRDGAGRKNASKPHEPERVARERFLSVFLPFA